MFVQRFEAWLRRMRRTAFDDAKRDIQRARTLAGMGRVFEAAVESGRFNVYQVAELRRLFDSRLQGFQGSWHRKKSV